MISKYIAYINSFSLIVLVWLTICPRCIFAKQIYRFTLLDAMKFAQKQNPSIKKAKEDLAKTRLGISSASANIKPIFGMEIGRAHTHSYYIYSSDDKYLSSDDNTNEISIYFDQPIYNQGKFGIEKKRVKIGIDIGQYKIDFIKQKILLDVIGAYFNILKTQKIIVIRQQAKDRLLEYLYSAKIKYDVGEVEKNVVLRAEMELAQAESDLIEAKTNYRTCKEEIKRILNLSREDDIEIIKSDIDIGEITKIKKSIDSFIDCSYKRRSDYQIILKQIELSEENIRLAYSDFLPQINIEATYIKEGEKFWPKEEVYSIGAFMSIPLYNKGLRIYDIKEKKNSLRQMEFQKQELEQQVQFEVKNAYSKLISLIARHKATEKQKEYATENMRITKLQFNEGIASNLDVLDAHLKLVEADTNRATLEYEIIYARYALKMVTGDLSINL